MLYNGFQNEKLSALGFGAMRLPLLADGSIDQAELERMVDAAMAAGVNYYDTRCARRSSVIPGKAGTWPTSSPGTRTSPA